LPQSKLLALADAVERFVPDGCSVAAGLCLEAMIPFAAGREIMRQRRRGLTLIGPISDMLFDQLIGAGCAAFVKAAWVGNVITGSGYRFRHAVESGALGVEDHSNLTIAMALKAAAMGVPFMPVRTALGSGLFATHPGLKPIHCPFTGQSLAAVPAIAPDVALIHVQRADEFGNVHVWGNLGVMRDACLASRSIVVTAEEIVSPERIMRDPNRIAVPGFRVSAVSRVPWGAHPSPVPGFYNRDHQAFIDYRRQSRTPEAFAAWRQGWVDDARRPEDYLELLGAGRMETLQLKHHELSEPVDYGY
jgi:glutaconate CoA-transferase subunit A